MLLILVAVLDRLTYHLAILVKELGVCRILNSSPSVHSSKHQSYATKKSQQSNFHLLTLFQYAPQSQSTLIIKGSQIFTLRKKHTHTARLRFSQDKKAGRPIGGPLFCAI